jgi:hypothetical protein
MVGVREDESLWPPLLQRDYKTVNDRGQLPSGFVAELNLIDASHKANMKWKEWKEVCRENTSKAEDK